MKKFKYTIASFAVLVTAALFMSFTSPPENNGNGNIVTVDFVNYFWIADNCDTPWVLIENVRVQTATNGHVNVTGSFTLPEGHCDIPEKGAITNRYPDGVSRAVINSKGKVNFKVNISPDN